MVSYIEENYSTDSISFVDLKGVIDVEVLWSCSDVDKVAEHFRKENVDAVFIIAANFGNEQAAGELTKKLGKPVLLWGPQDDYPEADGLRYTDSQCGLFGISRQLQRMNVPFTYIENCPVDDKTLADGIKRFASVACAVRNFKGMRLGQVGLRPEPFCSVICNEGQLMEDFDIHLIPIKMTKTIQIIKPTITTMMIMTIIVMMLLKTMMMHRHEIQIPLRRIQRQLQSPQPHQDL